MLKNRKESRHYPGLEKDYYLYAVEVSLTVNSLEQLGKNSNLLWYTLKEIPGKTTEPNILAIVRQLTEITVSDDKQTGNPSIGPVKKNPSMDALANMWAKKTMKASGNLRKTLL